MIYQKDVFLCHASEDKETVIRPIANALNDAGISYWLDEAEIKWGDSISAKVNSGFIQSKFMIVVISSTFLTKHWPQRELNAALNMEASTGEVRVLPIIAGSESDCQLIISAYPLLNDKLFIKWEGNTDIVIQELKCRLGLAALNIDATFEKVTTELSNNITQIPMPNIRKHFTQKDKDDYLQSAYNIIAKYFQHALTILEQKTRSTRTMRAFARSSRPWASPAGAQPASPRRSRAWYRWRSGPAFPSIRSLSR